MQLRSREARRSYVAISRFIRLHCATPFGSERALAVKTSCCQRRQIGTDGHSSNKEKPAGRTKDFVEDFKRSLTFPPPTHEIEDIGRRREDLIGKNVTVHGYLGERNDMSKGLSFLPVVSKDLRYSIQIVSLGPKNAGGDGDCSAHARLKSVEANSAVAVGGIVRRRAPAKTGPPGTTMVPDVEIELRDLQCLNEFPKDIVLKAETNFPPAQRHLQIRAERHLRDALLFRARAAQTCRDELGRQAFVEIETPTLFKSTPEGAREFLVPTRNRGLAYALPQSPQQYKQILMASGVPRYYQMARCFRDEDLRADRQPEFTQLDLEMSFATGEDVMRCIETLVRRLWRDLLGIDGLPAEFPRMSYDDAMSRYGSDKPYPKLSMEISRIDHLVSADLVSKTTPLSNPIIEVLRLRISEGARAARDFINSFMASPQAKTFLENPHGGPGVFVVDAGQPLQGLHAFGFEAAQRLEDALALEHGDTLITQARPRAPFAGGSTVLGNLRLALHQAAVAQGLLHAPEGFDFLWVTDFPLFSPATEAEPGQGGTAGLCSTHHPFTSPKSADDVDLLSTAPTQAKADHYDLVLNGVELGGGSRRIHDARMQAFILKEVLKMPRERLDEFSHLLEILRAGCPPHAGIALGFDRLIAVMLGRQSIRDVIAFPKGGKGDDPLVKSPSPMSKAALETYHLRVAE